MNVWEWSVWFKRATLTFFVLAGTIVVQGRGELTGSLLGRHLVRFIVREVHVFDPTAPPRRVTLVIDQSKLDFAHRLLLDDDNSRVVDNAQTIEEVSLVRHRCGDLAQVGHLILVALGPRKSSRTANHLNNGTQGDQACVGGRAHGLNKYSGWHL